MIGHFLRGSLGLASVTVEWLPILTLIVSALGALRGVYAFREWRRKQPNLIAVNDGGLALSEYTASDGKPVTLIVGFFTLSNSGQMPLIPNDYALEVEAAGHWALFGPMHIPAGATMSGDRQEIKTPDLSRMDLRKFEGAIVAGEPHRGALAFVSRQVSLARLHQLSELDPPTRARLICWDISGKRHVHTFLLPPKMTASEDIHRFGIQVRVTE